MDEPQRSLLHPRSGQLLLTGGVPHDCYPSLLLCSTPCFIDQVWPAQMPSKQNLFQLRCCQGCSCDWPTSKALEESSLAKCFSPPQSILCVFTSQSDHIIDYINFFISKYLNIMKLILIHQKGGLLKEISAHLGHC